MGRLTARGDARLGLPDARMDLDHTAERRIGRFVYLSYTVRRAPRE